MKNILYKWLFALIFASCLSTPGFAWYGGGSSFYFSVGTGYYNPYYYPYNRGYYYNPGYYTPRYYYNRGYYYPNNYGYRSCGWVRGHYEYGYWVPGRRVCWYN